MKSLRSFIFDIAAMYLRLSQLPAFIARRSHGNGIGWPRSHGAIADVTANTSSRYERQMKGLPMKYGCDILLLCHCVHSPIQPSCRQLLPGMFYFVSRPLGLAGVWFPHSRTRAAGRGQQLSYSRGYVAEYLIIAVSDAYPVQLTTFGFLVESGD